jgi:hypothetical protein
MLGRILVNDLRMDKNEKRRRLRNRRRCELGRLLANAINASARIILGRLDLNVAFLVGATDKPAYGVSLPVGGLHDLRQRRTLRAGDQRQDFPSLALGARGGCLASGLGFLLVFAPALAFFGAALALAPCLPPLAALSDVSAFVIWWVSFSALASRTSIDPSGHA